MWRSALKIMQVIAGFVVRLLFKCWYYPAQLIKRLPLGPFALLLVALAAKLAFFCLFLAWGIVESSIRWELRRYLFSVAYILDVMLGVVGQYPLNHILTLPGGHRIGDPLESISYAIGRSHTLGRQTKFSQDLERWVLNTIDANHCAKAVSSLHGLILKRAAELQKNK